MEIKLHGIHGKDRVAHVSEEDFSRVNKHRWLAHKSPNTYYAKSYIDGKYVYMHRFIMDAPDGMDVDHKDGNGLNNVRDNISVVPHAINMLNQKKHKSLSSEYKGVSYVKHNSTDKKWLASISYNLQRTKIGYYTDPREAAMDYDRCAIYFHGEYASLNFPELMDFYMSDLHERLEPILNPAPKGTSVYTGVQWDKHKDRWRAKVSVGGKKITIGYFKDEKECAIAFDKYVIEHKLGRKLNFPEMYGDPS